ncbi:MAG: hypothetical protein Q8P67_18885 [archaeon]|nr:hypothetical protein [archaeon]
MVGSAAARARGASVGRAVASAGASGGSVDENHEDEKDGKVTKHFGDSFGTLSSKKRECKSRIKKTRIGKTYT